MKTTRLYGNKELAEVLGWKESKTNVYYKRGKFEEPLYVLGNRPAWTAEQVERIKHIVEMRELYK